MDEPTEQHISGSNRTFLEAFAREGGAWDELTLDGQSYPRWIREFWTSRQRQASCLHEISYRACYKPQLPRLFIEHLTRPGDRIYDPFGGRGTTALEAALLGRRATSNDINPLSAILAQPRLSPPDPQEVAQRLKQIPRQGAPSDGLDVSMFFHPDTEAEIRALRAWFGSREHLDPLDAWIRMVATNRLTGHSKGFFSVYTLPPNQAVTAQKQLELNRKRNQAPEYRDTHALILKKTRQLQSRLTDTERRNLSQAAQDAHFLTRDARDTSPIRDGSIQLTVTSPPFLDVIQYAGDNWLRCWFCNLDTTAISQNITMARTLPAWIQIMQDVFHELARLTAPGGHIAFEVGEIRKGRLRLEEAVLPMGLQAGLHPMGILVNQQDFTKTANIWGITNNARGTNSNRIVLFQKRPPRSMMDLSGTRSSVG